MPHAITEPSSNQTCTSRPVRKVNVLERHDVDCPNCPIGQRRGSSKYLLIQPEFQRNIRIEDILTSLTSKAVLPKANTSDSLVLMQPWASGANKSSGACHRGLPACRSLQSSSLSSSKNEDSPKSAIRAFPDSEIIILSYVIKYLLEISGLYVVSWLIEYHVRLWCHREPQEGAGCADIGLPLRLVITMKEGNNYQISTYWLGRVVLNYY